MYRKSSAGWRGNRCFFEEKKEKTKTVWFDSFKKMLSKEVEFLKALSKEKVTKPGAQFNISDKIVRQKRSICRAEKTRHQSWDDHSFSLEHI